VLESFKQRLKKQEREPMNVIQGILTTLSVFILAMTVGRLKKRVEALERRVKWLLQNAKN
jgi:hypothetical protein